MDVAALQNENQQLREDLSQERQTLVQERQRIAQLEELVRTLRQRHFGASSEQSPDQIGLFDEEPDAEPAAEPETATSARPRARSQRRPRISEDLPRVDVIHDLDPADRICSEHGCELTPMGEETSEQIEFIPAKVQVLRHICRKYTCSQCDGNVVTAKKPPQPIPGSMATPSLLAWVAVSKYMDALPLYRQGEIFQRIGFEVDRSTLANWMIASGQLIQPLINLLRERLLSQPLIHMDETRVQVLAEPGRDPQTQSYMWVSAAGPPGERVVLFDYRASRSAAVPQELLPEYAGTLMVDGYEGYEPVCATQGIRRLGCWAHARRKFIEAQRLQPKGKTGKPDQALALINRLYGIERELKEVTAEERHQQRQERSAPVLEQLHVWLEKHLPRTAPKTAIGKAMNYLDRQWPRLVGYVEDGIYPIDNNRGENAVRPFVIGRKNWMFSQSIPGAKASANLYGLIETAKANGVEPMNYLMAVFEALPAAESLADIEALLPGRFRDGV